MIYNLTLNTPLATMIEARGVKSDFKTSKNPFCNSIKIPFPCEIISGEGDMSKT